MNCNSTANAQHGARRLLCRALAHPTSLTELPPQQLDATLRLARRARLLGRLAHELAGRGLVGSFPSVVSDQLLSGLIAARAEAHAARWELDRIAWALSGLEDVPVVALKGCAYLLAGTPNAGGRTLSDVDLLVPEARLEEVEARLLKRGWRARETTAYDQHYYRAWAHELPPLRHLERGTELDLHQNILMRTARLKPSAELLLDASRPIPGSRFRVLAPADMVLHAMTHLFYGGEVADALRELVDIDDLLRHFGANEPGFWGMFWSRARQLDLERPAYYGLRFAAEILNTDVPPEVGASARAGAPGVPIRWLMANLVPKALFPRSLDGRSHSADVARFALYLRSHWVKMPPLQLAQHLLHKARA